VGEGKSKMGRLPEAVGQTEARRQEELALPLQMHDGLRPERVDATLAVSRQSPANRSAVVRRAALALLHLGVIAGQQLIVSEPARAADAKPDQCGLASVYSTLSEETASGQDTSVNDRTAAHRSLPFGTLVRVDNQENGNSAIVRITDRGPFVSGRIVDVSQIAAHELGFADLTQVCLKILSLPEKRPGAED
jgi:rare lipoprotein A